MWLFSLRDGRIFWWGGREALDPQGPMPTPSQLGYINVGVGWRVASIDEIARMNGTDLSAARWIARTRDENILAATNDLGADHFTQNLATWNNRNYITANPTTRTITWEPIVDPDIIIPVSDPPDDALPRYEPPVIATANLRGMPFPNPPTCDNLYEYLKDHMGRRAESGIVGDGTKLTRNRNGFILSTGATPTYRGRQILRYVRPNTVWIEGLAASSRTEIKYLLENPGLLGPNHSIESSNEFIVIRTGGEVFGIAAEGTRINMGFVGVESLEYNAGGVDLNRARVFSAQIERYIRQVVTMENILQIRGTVYVPDALGTDAAINPVTSCRDCARMRGGHLRQHVQARELDIFILNQALLHYNISDSPVPWQAVVRDASRGALTPYVKHALRSFLRFNILGGILYLDNHPNQRPIRSAWHIGRHSRVR